MRDLTPAMQTALAIAKRDGTVSAGASVHAGRIERVNARTLDALIRRGLLTHCYGSEGGYSARLP